MNSPLIELTGGRSGFAGEASFLWINNFGNLVDVAAIKGLDYPQCRGRTPLLFDWNLDGWLDVMYTCTGNVTPSQVFTWQSNGVFVPVSANEGFTPPKANQYAQLMASSYSARPNVYLHSRQRGGILFNTSVIPWRNNPNSAGYTMLEGIMDSGLADIDGDLLLDVVATRIQFPPIVSGVAKVSTNQINLSLLTNKASFLTVKLKAASDIQIFMKSNPLRATHIHIGAPGANPINIQDFSLRASDITTHGMPPFVLGVDTGGYIGYDPVTSLWTITQTSTAYTPLAAQVFGTNIRIVDKVGFAKVPSDVVVRKSSTGQVTHLPYKFANSLVMADFDNDMDLDIFLVRSRLAVNLPNVLLLNDGQGNFSAVNSGITSSVLGIGDAVSSVDYDMDGRMDLLVTNGGGNPLLSENGPVRLLRNISTASNHWLAIDLVGTASNIEGIGATIVVTTADGKSQMRHQGGGMHRHTQNHSRLHVGLGANTLITKLLVTWPNGYKEAWFNMPVDQVARIVEGSGAAQ